MQIPASSPYPGLSALIAEIKRGTLASRAGPDPWDGLVIAAADNARFFALACDNGGPMHYRRAEVRELIKELQAYSAKNTNLPEATRVAIYSAAVMMGMDPGTIAPQG